MCFFAFIKSSKNVRSTKPSAPTPVPTNDPAPAPPSTAYPPDNTPSPLTPRGKALFRSDRVFQQKYVEYGMNYGPQEGTGLRVSYEPNDRGSPRIDHHETFAAQSEATLSYHILFETGFEWKKGGKLPGFLSEGNQTTTGCVQPQPKDAWSFRLMWKQDGQLDLYIYDQRRSEENIPCGVATRVPNFQFETGRWYHIEMYMKVNSNANSADGIAQVSIDGNEVYRLDTIPWRGVDNGALIDKLHFSTFYGGSDPSWAPDQTTHIQFASFEVKGASRSSFQSHLIIS